MEQEFQTTFIPKKSMAPPAPSRRRRSFGLLTFIAVLLVIIAGASAGGVIVYERWATTSLVEKQASLEAARDIYEESLLLELQMLDNRLKASTELLGQHTLAGPVFTMLERSTLNGVRFSSFQLTREGGALELTLGGEATDFTAIAQQSVVFGKEAMIQEHIFSNFVPTRDDTVSFDVRIRLNSSFLSADRQTAS